MSESKKPARVIMVNLAIACDHIPTDEEKHRIITGFIRVAKEGMKVDLLQAQLLVFTEEQIDAIAQDNDPANLLGKPKDELAH